MTDLPKTQRGRTGFAAAIPPKALLRARRNPLKWSRGLQAGRAPYGWNTARFPSAPLRSNFYSQIGKNAGER
ncbi:MAG TPA: hypothetical protein DEB39_06635 [Planctomycetaceae bacterium]|nr:hypothetical protein [Planctomycetaceae bacterium]